MFQAKVFNMDVIQTVNLKMVKYTLLQEVTSVRNVKIRCKAYLKDEFKKVYVMDTQLDMFSIELVIQNIP